MAGLTAAAHAAADGRRVVVIEKGARAGGSAALLGRHRLDGPGPRRRASRGTQRRRGAGGRAGRRLRRGHRADPIRRRLGERAMDRPDGLRRGPPRRHRRAARSCCRSASRSPAARSGSRPPAAGSWSTTTGRSPARRPRDGEGTLEVRAGSVLIATGGFQGDPELVQRLIGFDADLMPVRSNPWSVGDGLRMAQAVGASASRCLGGFYGHLLPSPLARFAADDFLPLTQYHSSHSILVDFRGRRFCDESLGDEASNQAALRLRGARARAPVRRGGAAPARRRGALSPRRRRGPLRCGGGRRARVSRAPRRIEALAAEVAGWGVDGSALLETLRGYDGRGGGSGGRAGRAASGAAHATAPPAVPRARGPAVDHLHLRRPARRRRRSRARPRRRSDPAPVRGRGGRRRRPGPGVSRRVDPWAGAGTPGGRDRSRRRRASSDPNRSTQRGTDARRHQRLERPSGRADHRRRSVRGDRREAAGRGRLSRRRARAGRLAGLLARPRWSRPTSS